MPKSCIHGSLCMGHKVSLVPIVDGLCENCGVQHDGQFGSGRFCTKSCSSSFSKSGAKTQKASRRSDNFCGCCQCDDPDCPHHAQHGGVCKSYVMNRYRRCKKCRVFKTDKKRKRDREKSLHTLSPQKKKKLAHATSKSEMMRRTLEQQMRRTLEQQIEAVENEVLIERVGEFLDGAEFSELSDDDWVSDNEMSGDLLDLPSDGEIDEFESNMAVDEVLLDAGYDDAMGPDTRGPDFIPDTPPVAPLDFASDSTFRFKESVMESQLPSSPAQQSEELLDLDPNAWTSPGALSAAEQSLDEAETHVRSIDIPLCTQEKTVLRDGRASIMWKAIAEVAEDPFYNTVLLSAWTHRFGVPELIESLRAHLVVDV